MVFFGVWWCTGWLSFSSFSLTIGFFFATRPPAHSLCLNLLCFYMLNDCWIISKRVWSELMCFSAESDNMFRKLHTQTHIAICQSSAQPESNCYVVTFIDSFPKIGKKQENAKEKTQRDSHTMKLDAPNRPNAIEHHDRNPSQNLCTIIKISVISHISFELQDDLLRLQEGNPQWNWMINNMRERYIQRQTVISNVRHWIAIDWLIHLPIECKYCVQNDANNNDAINKPNQTQKITFGKWSFSVKAAKAEAEAEFWHWNSLCRETKNNFEMKLKKRETETNKTKATTTTKEKKQSKFN